MIVNGASPLRGSVTCSPSQSIFEKMALCALLGTQDVELRHISNLASSHPFVELLQFFGVEARVGNEAILINPREFISGAVPERLALSAGTFGCLFFVLLAKFKRVALPLDIGGDHSDLTSYLDEYWKNIINYEQRGNYVTAEFTGTPVSAKSITLRHPSSEYTMYSLLLSSGLSSSVTLKNVSFSPTVHAVVETLSAIGYQVHLNYNEKEIILEPVRQFTAGSAVVPTETTESIFIAVAAILTEGDVEIKGVRREALLSLLNKLRQSGANFKLEGDNLKVWHNDVNTLVSTEIKTGYYPEVQSKWLGMLAVYMSQLQGVSQLHERMAIEGIKFIESLKHTSLEYTTLPVDKVDVLFPYDQQIPNVVYGVEVFGPVDIVVEELDMNDFTDGLIPLMIALISESKTEVHNIDRLLLMYPQLLEKLQRLGARIKVTS